VPVGLGVTAVVTRPPESWMKFKVAFESRALVSSSSLSKV
jgi:hypothetical protein